MKRVVSFPPVVSAEKNITYDDLLQIIELIKSSSQFGEFHLKIGDIELDLKRGPSGAFAAPPPPPPPPQTAPPPPPPASREEPPPASPQPIEARSAAQPPAGADLPPGAVVIKAPMVGTFYRAPEPGQPPFVEAGQRVGADAVVCIIEVMKLMNSIPAGRAGTVTRILVENGDPVEFGQALMVITPE